MLTLVGIVLLSSLLYYVGMSYTLTYMFKEVGKDIGLKTALRIPYTILKGSVDSYKQEDKSLLGTIKQVLKTLVTYQLYAVVLVEIIVHDTYEVKKVTYKDTTKQETVDTYKKFLQELDI